MKSTHTLTARITTATASTSALFALQHQADAAIIYSGPNQNLTAAFAGNTGAAYKALSIGVGLTVARWNASLGDAQILVKYGGDAATLPGVNVGSQRFLKKFAAGAVISGPQIHTTGGAAMQQVSHGVVVAGTWGKNQIGFAGFRLADGDLGWVRLEWTINDSDPTPDSMTAIDWAYDTTPGESIEAGQTTSVPEPSTAALLALAAGGAPFLRRKRASAGKS